MTEQTVSRAKNARPLLIIIAIAILATIVPYIMYYTGFGIPEATTNEGILVRDPVVMTEFEFQTEGGSPWALAEQEPKFRLMIPVAGACDDACRETLYITRQVRTRLAGDREQLERVFVQLGEGERADFKQYLSEEHPDLIYLRGDAEQWREAFDARPELPANFDGEAYYVLHRYGALGLAYGPQHSGNQLLDDLEFLIKTSN
ncbi:hypothetical protein F6455_12120 [Proteobacteria bacterium 005FR1]|nr:hypothetical protein [Proteobacteria bacterium 005FR1]